MKKKIYKVIIIGLGKAGSTYNVKKNKFFSHADAILKNRRLKLVAGVDINKDRIKDFEKKYKIKGYHSLKNLINHETFDIIVVAVPTEKQFTILKKLIDSLEKKTILCEKPCTSSLDEIKYLKKLIRNKRIKLYANFQRNSLISSKILKELIVQNKNNIINVSYSHGVLNSASHYISLFLSLFSKEKIKIQKEKNYKSHNKKDFLSNFSILFGKYKVNFIVKVHYKKIHGAFEIVNNSMKIKYLLGGRKIVLKSNVSQKLEYLKSDIQYSQLKVYEELVNKLDGKKSILSSIDNIIKTHKVINFIK